jgi:hypothetical protein
MRNKPVNRRTLSESVSRRTVLRGAGVAMALPWLESIPVWGAANQSNPKRFAALFMANGINPNEWWAKGSGADMELGKCLEPLAPFTTKMNFVKGLFNRAAVGVGIHPGQTGNLLSGAQLKKGAELGGGISMDQVLANHVGRETMQSSLVLGCEQPVTGYHETNFSMAYSSHISWQNSTSPVPMETYPALAFDSLFENRGTTRNRSILDRVQGDARSLSRQVSASDQAKLDEYLTSVREVEKRIDRIRAAADKAANKARDRGRSVLSMDRPDNGLPEDIRDHMKLMCDIIAMAFQTDKTRVATLLLCRDISGLIYPFLGVRHGHHTASHGDTSDGYLRIVRYHCSQAAYLAKRLASMEEGDSNVLDNSLLLFLSNMWSGSRHDSTKVPVVLIGGLGGTLKTGRILDYSGTTKVPSVNEAPKKGEVFNYSEKGDEHRKLCSLYLSIMDRMGVSLDKFGDANTRLTGL